MLLRLLILLFALLPLPAAAQSLQGSWALKVEGATIFRFDLEPEGTGWDATWWRPRTFGIDGDAFHTVSGPPVAVSLGASKTAGEWTELTFPDNRPGAVPDVFRIRLLGPERAELIYADTGIAPFVLVRVPPGTAPGPWQAARRYSRATVASLGLPGDPKVTPTGQRPPAPGQAPTWSLPASAKPPLASPSAAKPPAGTTSETKPVMIGR